ncbi:DUF554 domain-containing protein [Bacillus testis]|uniref:DUF554 domain-containing protein n=1 Tax=Bacillus testis TaxID=1622072 RepID=UPI00067EFC4B|nr:DUF554 domain-containing protein [Bacillus testis]
MVLLGSIVNGIGIAIGTLVGRIFRNIPEKMKETIMYAIGLVVVLIGIQMGIKSEQILIVILSLVIGAALGEWWALDEKLNAAGHFLERMLKSKGETQIAEAFVNATLIFVIGAMAILGALDSGIRGDHSVLYTKAIIDGFTAIVLASALGIGVLFSAVPVMLYEGLIAVCAKAIAHFVPGDLLDLFIVEMGATGGIMIVAIGLNIMGITKIRVANLLPAIVMAVMLVAVFYYGHIQL